MKFKLGSHVPFKSPNYLYGAVAESLANGANCAMVYLGAPQNSRRAKVDKYQYDKYLLDQQKLIPQEDIVVHAPYITNPASLDPQKSQFAVDFLVQEILRMQAVKLKHLVLHPGASTKYDRKLSYQALEKNLQTILLKTADSGVIISLETMAGKGTEIGTSLESLKEVLDHLDSPRLGICLDTCHLWDAGYNLHAYEKFMQKLISLDLLKKVKVIHLNDAKYDIGNHKDRHENINQGFLGLETLAKFVHDERFQDVPIILETPVPKSGSIYKEEIKMLLTFKPDFTKEAKG